MKLVLKNNVDKKSFTYDNIEDLEKSRLNFCFAITPQEGMAEGEYNYFLYDDDKFITSGILQFGDFIPEATIHHQTNNGFKQYNPR